MGTDNSPLKTIVEESILITLNQESLKGNENGMHGYLLLQRLNQASSRAGRQEVPTSSLYKALDRLERNKLIEGHYKAKEEHSRAGEQRYCYFLTEKGEKVLQETLRCRNYLLENAKGENEGKIPEPN